MYYSNSSNSLVNLSDKRFCLDSVYTLCPELGHSNPCGTGPFRATTKGSPQNIVKH